MVCCLIKLSVGFLCTSCGKVLGRSPKKCPYCKAKVKAVIEETCRRSFRFLNTSVELKFGKVYYGVGIREKETRKPCSMCESSGIIRDEEGAPYTCPKCNGRGYVIDFEHPGAMEAYLETYILNRVVFEAPFPEVPDYARAKLYFSHASGEARGEEIISEEDFDTMSFKHTPNEKRLIEDKEIALRMVREENERIKEFESKYEGIEDQDVGEPK